MILNLVPTAVVVAWLARGDISALIAGGAVNAGVTQGDVLYGTLAEPVPPPPGDWMPPILIGAGVI